MASIVGEIKVNQLSISRNPDDPKIATYTIMGTQISDVFYNEKKPELMTFQDQLKVTEVTYAGTVLATYYITVIDVGDFLLTGNVINKLVITGERLQADGERERATVPIVPNDIMLVGNVLFVRYPYYGEDSQQATEIQTKYKSIRFNDKLYYCHTRVIVKSKCSENCTADWIRYGIIAIYTTTKVPSLRDLEDAMRCGWNTNNHGQYYLVLSNLVKSLRSKEEEK